MFTAMLLCMQLYSPNRQQNERERNFLGPQFFWVWNEAHFTPVHPLVFGWWQSLLSALLHVDMEYAIVIIALYRTIWICRWSGDRRERTEASFGSITLNARMKSWSDVRLVSGFSWLMAFLLLAATRFIVRRESSRLPLLFDMLCIQWRSQHFLDDQWLASFWTRDADQWMEVPV